MLQNQNNPLNRSRTPERRQQVQPGPAVLASGGEIEALKDRATALETSVAGLQAHDATTDGWITAAEGAIATLQGQVATLGNGSLKLGVRKITASATANGTDYLILADAAAGNIVVTLPALTNGRSIAVKKIDATGNTVSIASAANIDGAASQLVTPQYASFVVMCDGVTWWIV